MQKDRLVELSNDIIINYGNKLGQGSYAQVYSGFMISKGIKVAIKKFKDEAIKSMQNQFNFSKQINHQNIMHIYDKIDHKDQGSFLILQYCTIGPLTDQLNKRPLPQLNCFNYIKQIIFGMAKINQANHIHRDLKPDNILLTKGNVLKIADFGLSKRIIGDVNQMQQYSCRCTPIYSSPQIIQVKYKKQIQQKETDIAWFSGKCDVWSAGIILIQMLTQKHIVYHNNMCNNYRQLYIRINNLLKQKGYIVLQGNYHQWFKQMVKLMTAKNQQDRYSFQQLKQKIIQDQPRVVKELKSIYHLSLYQQKEHNYQEKSQLTITILNNWICKTNSLKQIQSQHQKNNLAQSLKMYIQYVWGRSQLFMNAGIEFFKSARSYNQEIRNIIYFLCTAISIKTCQELILLIQFKKCSLPDGSLVLDQIFNKLDKYRETLEKNNIKFYKVIEKIDKINLGSKLSFQKHTEEHQRYSILISQLKALNEKRTPLNWKAFKLLFNDFVIKQILKQLKYKNKQQYKALLLIVMLVKSEKDLPDSKFKDNCVLNEYVQSVKKAQYQQQKRMQKLQQLKKQIIKLI